MAGGATEARRLAAPRKRPCGLNAHCVVPRASRFARVAVRGRPRAFYDGLRRRRHGESGDAVRLREALRIDGGVADAGLIRVRAGFDNQKQCRMLRAVATSLEVGDGCSGAVQHIAGHTCRRVVRRSDAPGKRVAQRCTAADEHDHGRKYPNRVALVVVALRFFLFCTGEGFGLGAAFSTRERGKSRHTLVLTDGRSVAPYVGFISRDIGRLALLLIVPQSLFVSPVGQDGRTR